MEQEDIVKDKTLLTTEKHEGKVHKYTLKNIKPDGSVTKLSDVLKSIPPGIVYKDETGMGATYLELETLRNSIIVEPLKVTALSKAKEHNAFYVGGIARTSPTKVTEADIIAYLKNKKPKNKKILVVADSLYKVINALDKLGEEYKNYFLLLDEVDSFQLDSNYRSSMESCIEIYKRFPEDRRALLSATQISFSDPELKKEFKTFLKYDKPQVRDIQLFYTDNLKGAAVEMVVKRLSSIKDEKILVAFNSVQGCYSIAQYLVEQGMIEKDDIKIMCSRGNKEKDFLKSYFHELDEPKLPAKLTFITSAYFTGFDLNESFHLISLSGNIQRIDSDNFNRIHSLSDKKMKQVAGRCRTGLLSECIIYDVPIKEESNDFTYTEEILIKTASTELDALECVKKHFYNDVLLKENYERIRELIIQNTHSLGHRFVTKDFQGKNKISYLNIDSYLEAIRVRNEVYSNKEKLHDLLQQAGHNVNFQNLSSAIHVATIDISSNITREEEVSTIIEQLKRLQQNQKPTSILTSKSSKLQTLIVEGYERLYDYIDNEQLLAKIQIAAIKRDSRALNTLFQAGKSTQTDPLIPLQTDPHPPDQCDPLRPRQIDPLKNGC